MGYFMDQSFADLIQHFFFRGAGAEKSVLKKDDSIRQNDGLEEMPIRSGYSLI